MTKCWIHGETAKKETKPLKDVVLPDNDNYQENLAIILAPNDNKKQNEEKQELLNKFKKEQNNSFFLTQQAVKDNEFIRNLKKKLKIVGSKSFYFANQQLNKDITEIRQLVTHLQTDLTAEKQDKEHIQEELDKALEILNKPTAEMGTQTDIEWREMNKLEIAFADLATKELDLTTMKRINTDLFPYFQKLGLTKTWQYFNEICQDYFNSLEIDQAERERERERERDE